MRRLLNRVHQLLYAQGTGTAASGLDRFPAVVAELDHQLDEWRDVLPSAFQFTVDAEPAQTEAGGFLRQRYLTCRSVIYRPYLMWMLISENGTGNGTGTGNGEVMRPRDDRGPGTTRPPNPQVLAGCRLCLEACLLHVLNLRGFAQTVLVDTWICSLS